MVVEIFYGIEQNVLAGIIAGAIRSVLGWADNSLRDGEVSKPEIRLLAHTMVKYVALVALVGVGADTPEAVAMAFGLDYMGDKFKKAGGK